MKLPRILILLIGIFIGLQVLWVIQPRVECSETLREFNGRGKVACEEGSGLEIVTIGDKVYFACHCPSENKNENAEFIKLRSNEF